MDLKIIKDTCYKGTRIILGDSKPRFLEACRNYLRLNGFTEIQIPIIQQQEIFEGKVGPENNNMMFNFRDRGNRELCLAPEYTAIIQKLSKTHFNNKKDVKLFYVAECFRGEKPQRGRYRQFTQLGVEILNPTVNWTEELLDYSTHIISSITDNYELNREVKRGLDYYKDGQGFEISCPDLGSSKQVCGGGQYEGGIGFAVGVDRLLDLK